MSRLKTPLLVVLGATGAGKSQLAIELAQKFGGEVISADAMQMYKGLDICTNKVTPEERQLVKHHMIDFLDPLSTHNVVDFRNMTLPIIDDLLQSKIIPVICGGTNYYIESLLWKVLVDKNDNNGDVDSDDAAAAVKRRRTNDVEDDDDESKQISTPDLYRRLQKVDPERASELHPNERRKILRSLKVFDAYQRKHSEILAEQQAQEGGGLLGGPLRYPDVVVFWVQCDQAVLDERCNKRVDKMIQLGMVQELEQFHKDYNSKRAKPDYTVGIFQSIGFKEFHEYLILDDETKTTEVGQKLFQQGVEQLKIVTRQYARRQLKWIRMRFLNPKRVCPPVFAFDSTQPFRWNETAYEPAVRVFEALLEGSTPPQDPLPLSPESLFGFEEKRKVFRCDVCGQVMKGSIQYEAHIKSRNHLTKLKRLERKNAAAVQEQEISSSVKPDTGTEIPEPEIAASTNPGPEPVVDEKNSKV